MTALCHRSHCRGSQQRRHWCGHGISTTDGLHGRFHFNKWFVSHVYYTAAILSHLFMPDARRIVKRILPASSSASSASAASVGEDKTSSSDDCSPMSETHDTELEEFQNELRDFIHNLHFSSTSDVSVSTVAEF